jgi:spore germination protein YaaH
MRKDFYTVLIVAAVSFTPLCASAMEVSGWIPYWRDDEGIKDAKKHLESLDTIYPFAFTVTSKGELRDQADLNKKEWKKFAKEAKEKGVQIVPTVMHSDGAAMHKILSDDVIRKNHIEEIVDMVEDGDYDGVNIDYEARKAETKNYYSLFLKELKKELGKRLLTCTLEPRTPPDSLYKEIPKTINYSNEYKEIAKHCDRIEIMGYDQQRADIKLNASKNGFPYMPVSDVDWVEKVVELALKDFPKEKIVLGIPSYGHQYQITVVPNWFRDYRRIGALNVPDIKEVAKDFKVTPTRNKAGEMSFTYLPKTTDKKLAKELRIPKGKKDGALVAERALAYANKTGKAVTFNLGWYSDALAMKDKIDLAKKYGLRGVALFKIDGEEDPKVWKYLE